MPIRVQHDPSIESLAGLAALSGVTQQGNIEIAREQEETARKQRNFLEVQAREQSDRQLTQQLRQQREMQHKDIQARSDLQRQSADEAMARTAMQFGLDGQIREDEFNREMAQAQEQARIQAEQWEWRYSAQDRQEIARLNNADRAMANNPDFSEEEKQEYRRISQYKRAGITGSMVPRDPNKPTYAKGREPGMEFQDKGGNWHIVQPDGVTKMTLRWDQGPEAAKMKYEAEIAAARSKMKEERVKEIEEYIRNLRTERIKYDKDGTEIAKERYREPWEVYEETLMAYPELAGPQLMPQQVAPQAEPEVVTQAREALKAGWGMGLKKAGQAKAIIRAWERAQQEGNRQLTEAEIEKLPSGASFVAPDGTRRRKP